MIVRDAFPDEFGAIGELRVSAYRADGFLSAHSSYEPRLRALGADGDGDVLVAVRHGDVLGTVMLQPWPHAGEVARGPDEAEIRALAVAPAARRQGVGWRLLDAVTDRARQRGVRHLVLFTQREMVTAHRLYAAAGFVRLPDRDWTPEQDPVVLLAYGLILDPSAGQQRLEPPES